MKHHAVAHKIRHHRHPMAGAEYFRAKLEYEIMPWDLKELLDEAPDEFFLVDVRDAESFAQGHIPGATNIPRESLVPHLAWLPRNKTIVTYCSDVTCPLSAKAALELAQKGFRVRHLIGGLGEWSRKGLPVVSRGQMEDLGPLA